MAASRMYVVLLVIVVIVIVRISRLAHED